MEKKLIIGHLMHITLIVISIVFLCAMCVARAFQKETSPLTLSIWFLIVPIVGLIIFLVPFILSFVCLIVPPKEKTNNKITNIICMAIIMLLLLGLFLYFILTPHDLRELFIFIATFVLLISYPLFVVLHILSSKYRYFALILNLFFPLVYTIILTRQTINSLYYGNNADWFINVAFLLISLSLIALTIFEAIKQNKSRTFNAINIIIVCFFLSIVLATLCFGLIMMFQSRMSFEEWAFYAISLVILSVIPVILLVESKCFFNEI